MNNKNKVLLTSVGLALLSGIAATSSTFAWFTTTRTASISYTNAVVESKLSDLELTYLGNGNTAFTTAPALNTIGSTLTLAGGNKITDVSSNGINFYKPIWSAVEGEATRIDQITTAEGYYTEVNVKLANKGGTSMTVFLGTGTGVTSTTSTASDAAILAARMAVITGTTVSAAGVATGGTLKILHAPNDTTHGYLSASSTEPRKIFGTASLATEATKGTYGTIVDETAFVTASAIADANPNTQVGELAPLATLNVTFRVWLEGEDAHAVNAAIGGVFNFAANLYALEA